MVEATCEAGVEVRAQWVPGDTREIERADMWYRGDYAWDFALDRGDNGGSPTGDCLAGTLERFHQRRRYFTRYPAAEGMGVDALVMP
jgi:hypothetical protein